MEQRYRHLNDAERETIMVAMHTDGKRGQND